MRPETREAMEMLFCAKWNVPQAAKHCNLTRKEMMITFNEYCACLLYTSPSPRDVEESRMPSSA